VLGNSNGFLSVNSGTWNARIDQSFVQRQELIGFRKTVGSTNSFSTNVLQYLSTFSRETNSPSWKPTRNATDMGAPDNGPGSIYAYADNANSDMTTEGHPPINSNVLLRRVAFSFTRFDGTTAVVGEPLVKTRFPLSRLAWITYKGPSAVVYAANPNDPVILALTGASVSIPTIQAGTLANIKACFGLTFPTGGTAGSPWTY